jgi:predicted nucleotidyltransferase
LATSVLCGIVAIAMDKAVTSDPALRSFQAAVAELYGDALNRLVLFGSRARGDAKPDSDYDLAVFLKESDDLWAEWGRLADLRSRFLNEGGPFFEAIPFRVTDYEKRTPIMHEIRKGGLIL